MKRCTKCGIEKDESEFGRDRTRADGRFPWCLLCKRAGNHASYFAEHEVRKEQYRWRQRTMRTGVTKGEFEAMLLAQGGRCAICGRRSGDRGGKQDLVIDHDHESGSLRGLLCHRCNMALGLLEDDPGRILRAAAYLVEASERRHQRKGKEA